MRTVAIVQARLGSTRLPKKVLADLNGETMLGRLLRNLDACRRLDGVAVAVPRKDISEIVQHVNPFHGAVLCGVEGDESDVLRRYAIVAESESADVVVRITADCPLIDPRLVDQAVEAYCQYKRQPAYFWITGYPRGVGDIEIFSSAALRKANQKEDDPFRREHVWEAVAHVGTSKVPLCPPDLQRMGYRLCVDEPKDLDAVRAVMDALKWPQRNDVREIVALLDERPDLREINHEVVQAS